MSPRRIDVRPCSEADLDRLRADWPTFGSDIHGAHHSAQLSGRATYLVAWRGTTPMGSGVVQWAGCVGANARSAHPDCIEINHLQVRTDLRGQGAGSALIAAAEAMIRSRGHAEVSVGVSPENHDAARLYRRLGYEETGVRDTSSYTWIDAGGVAHDVTELDELLVKRLRQSRLGRLRTPREEHQFSSGPVGCVPYLVHGMSVRDEPRVDLVSLAELQRRVRVISDRQEVEDRGWYSR